VQLNQAQDGSKTLSVKLTQLEGGGGTGFHEVWLADAQAQRMVALGVLEGTSGTFAVPDGVSLQAYPLVDISLEPYDGDPAHSATSVARGLFPL
jgi:anti-sigma-K factor RskA